MPISGYFDVPFAVGGDLTAVPDGTQIDGSVSYENGYAILYSTPVGSGGFDFPRRQHNQILNDITTAIQALQQGSAPAFITSAMNGGSPYTYPAYAIVSEGGVSYISLVGSNADTPPSSKWAAITLGTGLLATNNLSDLVSASAARGHLGLGTAATQNIAAFLQPADNLSDVSNAATSRTNLGLGTAAVQNVGAFCQTANNLSDVANATTARGNLSAAKSGANSDITSLSAPALGSATATTQTASDSTTKVATTAFVQTNKLMTPLGVGAIAQCGHTGAVSLGGTVAGSTLDSVINIAAGASGGIQSTGDTLTGTWQALQTYTSPGANYATMMWQRIA